MHHGRVKAGGGRRPSPFVVEQRIAPKNMPISGPATGTCTSSPALGPGAARPAAEPAGAQPPDPCRRRRRAGKGRPGRRRSPPGYPTVSRPGKRARGAKLLHHVSAAAEGGQGQASAHHLAEAPQVGGDTEQGRRPAPGHPETGYHFVENEQGAGPVAGLAQALQEARARAGPGPCWPRSARR